MIEETVEQEVRFYRQAIMKAIMHVDPRFSWRDEIPEIVGRFETLAQSNLSHFRQVCLSLLADEQREVRWGAMELIRSCNIQKDHVLSMVFVHIALRQKDLREDALSALWHVRTRRVLPQLLLFAEKGYSSALYMIRPMLQTPEEIEQGIAIAQKYIGAKEYALREAALFLLQKHSTMEKEAERILVAVQHYNDEIFIDALKEAPAELVLEPLKTLRSSIEARFAAHGDLSSTIKALERREQSG